ncbi:MAG: lipoate--protein ligase [Bacteroidales bacterium]|nr:lipoate--protein ligase [Bacteroidales bacterium]
MFCLSLESTDPYFNLAVEEYLLKKSKEEYLILGINNPAVIIGKHQVAHREADTKFVTENDIPVIRRITGGGTVFHDNGNLNFTFISQSIRGKQVDFRKYTLPVIGFLTSLGVNAKFEGKNDLKVNGLKISGNAEHVHRERVLHHGTLLFNSRLDDLRSSLKKDTSKYTTRAVESNPSSVINIKEIIDKVKDINEFRSVLLNFFLKYQEGNTVVTLTTDEISEVKSIAESKYRTWEWNYAYGPEYHFTNNFLVHGKNHFCRLFVRDGIIWDCEIEGSDEMAVAGNKLMGCRHMPADILEFFRKEGILMTDFEVYNFF